MEFRAKKSFKTYWLQAQGVWIHEQFETFKVEEISIDEAEDKMVSNAREIFEETEVVNMSALKYDEGDRDFECAA